jgi:hypothetical protein
MEHAFADHVRRYCAFIERAASVPLESRVRAARAHLAELVRAACDLPIGDVDDADVDAEVHDPPGWPGMGEREIYWEVFDPYDFASIASVAGSLTDDLLDVYRDLRRGLLSYEAGRVGAAVWEWRFLFEHHWGEHAVDALRALHWACRRAPS